MDAKHEVYDAIKGHDVNNELSCKENYVLSGYGVDC